MGALLRQLRGVLGATAAALCPPPDQRATGLPDRPRGGAVHHGGNHRGAVGGRAGHSRREKPFAPAHHGSEKDAVRHRHGGDTGAQKQAAGRAAGSDPLRLLPDAGRGYAISERVVRRIHDPVQLGGDDGGTTSLSQVGERKMLRLYEEGIKPFFFCREGIGLLRLCTPRAL